MTVLDPSGAVVATSTTDPVVSFEDGAFAVTVQVAKPGTYTFQVVGDYAVSDPDTIDSDSALGRFVTLHVAQLRRG